MNMRRFLRKWHRDLGYFITGILLIYAVSGIALNHRKDWNPDYSVVSESIQLKKGEWKTYSSEEIGQLLQQFEAAPVYKKHFNSDEGVVKVFVENGMVIFDPTGGQAKLELLLKRPVFYHINKLHMAATLKAWVWVSDVLAAILIFVALSGLFILKGRNGLTGRGLWLTLLGILLPLFFIVFYIS